MILSFPSARFSMFPNLGMQPASPSRVCYYPCKIGDKKNRITSSLKRGCMAIWEISSEFTSLSSLLNVMSELIGWEDLLETGLSVEGTTPLEIFLLLLSLLWVVSLPLPYSPQCQDIRAEP